MDDLIRTTFGGLGELYDGPHATPPRVAVGPYFLNISSLRAGRLDLSASDHISADDFVKWTRRVTPRGGDLLFSYETRLGEAALMPDEVEACLGRRMALLRPNRSVVDSRFLLYFYLSPTFQRTIATHTIHGATVPRIGLATMPNWQVEIPGLSVQHAIAEILGALDDKISANDRAIGKLEELSVAEYRRELGRGVRLVEVDSIAEFHNRRRIPLSAKQRQERLGDVPYYGAAGCIGSVDAAIFNEPLVLVGEDGSVIRGDGKPVVQYIWGPAWVNNHAHVLTGRSVPTELLRIGIECANVAHLVTGAVQPKLSMGKLKSLTISLPVEHSLLDISLTRLAASVRGLSDENRRLASTRDELLPLLMSGRIRVKDATRVVEEVF